MKKYFLIYISFILSLSLVADPLIDTNQVSPKIDSLEGVLFNALSIDLSAPEKISICNALAELYSGISNEKRVEYASRSLKLAEEINDAALQIKPLEILGYTYRRLDNYEKSIKYYSKLIEIYKANNNEIEEANTLKEIGYSYFHWSKYVEANTKYEEALEIYKKHQYFEGIAGVLRGIAAILMHWGEYGEALNYNQEALKFWEEIGDKEGMAGSYNSIGMLYQELDSLDRASEYYNKSLKIFEELGSNWDIVNMTLHIGDIYLKKQFYNKALEYYFRADSIGKQVGNKKLKSITLSNIGEAYNLKGDYIKALDYQQKALELKEEIGDKKRLTITYTEMGIIYNNIEDYAKALKFLNKGLDIAKEINFKYQINKCYKSLSEVYYNISNYKKSLEYFKLYIEGFEQIYSEESKHTIAELQTIYQLEKKSKENERLRHNEQLNTAQIKNQQLIIGFVIFILIGSFILASIFHSRYQQNQKLNIQLSLKNKEIEHQQENVLNLNAELKEANAAKDKFFSILAHDLKNPFSSLIALSNMLIEEYNIFSEEERKQFIMQIKDSSENTFSLLQNLLEWASAQTGKTKLVREKMDMYKISEETIALLKPAAKNKNISIYSNIPGNTFAYADKNMISTVLLNLVSNAVKFTPHNGKVEINSIVENQDIKIQVSDNGVGISPENIKKLFLLGQKIQTKGTDKETGTGLGLVLCKEFVEKNDGNIWVESKEGEGSRFYFSLPKT
ncbi:MAG: tetratricopeptide repeat-containing sensor histidine kinase [Bacteroidales bacterium]|nr:tetratricopeptide repeat-containing sensor histidine kinase [Bacteroidales bacterium]